MAWKGGSWQPDIPLPPFQVSAPSPRSMFQYYIQHSHSSFWDQSFLWVSIGTNSQQAVTSKTLTHPWFSSIQCCNVLSIYLAVQPITLGTNISKLFVAQCSASLPLNVISAAILPHDIPVNKKNNMKSKIVYLVVYCTYL